MKAKEQERLRLHSTFQEKTGLLATPSRNAAFKT